MSEANRSPTPSDVSRYSLSSRDSGENEPYLSPNGSDLGARDASNSSSDCINDLLFDLELFDLNISSSSSH